MGEGLHVTVGHPPLKHERVAADSVEQRRGQALAYPLVGGDQVLGHDGGGGAIAGAHVLEGGVVRRVSLMMIDNDIGAAQAAVEVGRLHVDHSYPVKRRQFLGVGRRDLDLQQMHHGLVLRPRDRSEAEDRRGELVAT